MLALLLIVAVLTAGQPHEPVAMLLRQAACWLAFTIPGGPEINGVRHTFIITAGVTWSLPYEWLFYFALPLLALLIGRRPGWRAIVLSLVALAMLRTAFHPATILLCAFVGGIAAAWLVRFPVVRERLSSAVAALLAGLGLVGVVTLTPDAYSALPLALLAMVFIVVAAGNPLFGLLTWRGSRALGELAYGIYLLHGLVLFCLFRFVIGIDRAAGFSAVQHWATLAACVPLLLALCWLAFVLIERPAMRSVSAVVARLRAATAGGAAIVAVDSVS